MCKMAGFNTFPVNISKANQDVPLQPSTYWGTGIQHYFIRKGTFIT